MKNNSLIDSKTALEASFQNLENVDFSKFTPADRKEFKEELDEIANLILTAKSTIKQETN